MADHADITRKKAVLGGVPLLADLTASQLQLVAAHSSLRSFEAGATIRAPGSLDNRLHAIETGNVLVAHPEAAGGERVLATYIDGESFGELDLFGSEPGEYTVRAVTHTVLCSFPAPDEQVEEVLAVDPALGAELVERLLREIGERTRSANALVSEKAPWIEGLRRQILTDKLTGLPNATYLKQEMPGIIAKNGGDAAILMIKPDNFKQINDTYGHDAGDAVLIRLASTVRSEAEEGMCARFKGDVYCLIVADGKEADSRAQSVLDGVRALDLSDYTRGDGFVLTASVGMACCTEETVERACERAFSKVMQIREEGGDRFDWSR